MVATAKDRARYNGARINIKMKNEDDLRPDDVTFCCLPLALAEAPAKL